MEAKEPQVKLDVQVIGEHVVLPVSQEECTALMVTKYSMAPSEREVVAERRVKRAIEVCFYIDLKVFLQYWIFVIIDKGISCLVIKAYHVKT